MLAMVSDDPRCSSKPADPTRIKGKKRPFSAVVALPLEEAKSVVPLNEVPRWPPGPVLSPRTQPVSSVMNKAKGTPFPGLACHTKGK